MPTTGELLLQILAARGVSVVFGVPGNHTVALYRGFSASGMSQTGADQTGTGPAGIRHITSRHEQGAAFMADGYARASGRPGVCVLISGPGLLNAATAIAQANADCVPMLVVTGVAATGDLGMNRRRLHELPNQHATAASFCRDSYTLLDPNNLPELLDRAFTHLQSAKPGVVHIEIPLDLMEQPVTAVRPPVSLLPTSPGPDPAAITAAARRLEAASRPLILVGGGAVSAAAEITRLAEMLDAPVLNTVNGKGICPRGHPLAVGGSPALPVVRAALAQADAVLAIGTELGETDYDLLMAGAMPDTAAWVRIDIDPFALQQPTPSAIAITSDARLAVQQLLAAVQTQRRTSDGAERADKLRNAIREEAHYHVEMAEFFATLQRAAPDAVVVGDSSRPNYYAAWQYECAGPRRYFHSVSGFGTLGYALPAALGAALAVECPIIALIGDGGIQFTMPELTTGAQTQLPVAVIVWNNEGYAEIENSMRAQAVPVDSTRILTPDFESVARAHHCDYARPVDHAMLETAIKQAHGNTRPTVIEVRESDFLTQPSGQWYQ